MRRITLLRHAKSDWNNPSLNDFDRPLNQRGERDTALIGQRLKNNGVRPSLILCSDAKRAITTARKIAQEIAYPGEFIQPVNELYLASPATIIEVLSREGEEYNNIMLIAHNPGLTDLANIICDTKTDNIPTCGVYAVDVDIDAWADLKNTQGTLNYFEHPKKQA
jgi:phosphohistidine phosphatase